MRKIVLLLVVLCVFLTRVTLAQDVSISAGLFIGIINEDGKGPYQLILQEAAKRADVRLAERVYPLKRAVKMFTDKGALAIYGMTHAVIAEIGTKNIITSYPLGVYKLYIFTRKGEPPISDYSQLQGKSLGGVVGYEAYYQAIVRRGVDIQYVTDEKSQIKKLELKRIDAIIGFMPDWIPFLSRLTYDPGFPVHQGYDYMTVWNTPEGRSFVDRISPALQGMKADGTLKVLLGERYMDFDYQATQAYEWVPDASAE